MARHITRKRRIISDFMDSEIFVGYVCILPAFLLAVIFMFFPIGCSFWLSFTKWTGFGPIKWVGISNYLYLFRDPLWQKSMRITFTFSALTIPFQFVGALGLALLLNKGVKGIGIVRTFCLLPLVTSQLIVAIVWRYIYDVDWGVLNYFLTFLGLNKMKFLSSTSQALPSVAAVVIWQTMGFFMIIFLAALQDIPTELYEAAKIDGANSWQCFRFITFPSLKYSSLFVLIILTMDAFKLFVPIYSMTDGGPAQSTYVVVYYIWKTGFWFLKLGRASAIAVLLFCVMFAFTLVHFKVFRSAAEV